MQDGLLSFRCLQIADSAFPMGGYAYSYGLEAAVQRGLVSHVLQLKEYLHSFLRNAVFGELPFVADAFETEDTIGPVESGILEAADAPGERTAGVDALESILRIYDATLFSPSMRNTSLAQGKNWLRTLAGLYPHPRWERLSRAARKNGAPLHFVPLFGWGARNIGLESGETRLLFLYMAVRDQLSAAVRLGVLGPMENARLQKEFLERGAELMATGELVGHREAYKESPQVDICQ